MVSKPLTGRQVGASDDASQGSPRAMRERILDVALDLFTEQGFDATSLREISDRVGVTKAALYYHFRSKDEILVQLHMRLHQLNHTALDRLAESPDSAEGWRQAAQEFLIDLSENRALFRLHERNAAAFERIHMAGHEEAHEDFEGRLRAIAADSRIPLDLRLRLAATVGAVTSCMMMMEMFDSPIDAVMERLTGIIDDVLRAT